MDLGSMRREHEWRGDRGCIPSRHIRGTHLVMAERHARVMHEIAQAITLFAKLLEQPGPVSAECETCSSMLLRVRSEIL